MNQLAKCCVLESLHELEDLVKATIDEVEDCYEFARRSGEFYEPGDLVGFLYPVFIQDGHTISKGEVEEVFPDKRKVKMYCRHHPVPSRPVKHVHFTVGYDRIFLIKGNKDDEVITIPSKELKIEDVEIIRD